MIFTLMPWLATNFILTVLALTSSTNTLLIAMLIPILGVISPLLIARQINRYARATKIQDWERQDVVAQRAQEVAEQAAEAAKLVVERQEVLDEKTDGVAHLLKTSTSETNLQLKKIHGLVNSQYTEALKSELGATRDTLALMGELIENNRKAGNEPTTQMMAAFKGREVKIKELEDVLKIRQEADEQASAINSGPSEVIIVNPDPVPVVDKTETETETQDKGEGKE